MQWAHEHWGCEVWWIQPYPVRLPRLSDFRRLRRSQTQDLGPQWRNAPWLHTLSSPVLPVEPFALGRAWLQHSQRKLLSELLQLLADDDCWLVIGRPSGLAVDLCEQLQGRHVLYDVMDDMPHFSRGLSQRWMRKVHEQVLSQAELVWGSAQKLIDAMQGQTRQPPILVRNGTHLPAPAPNEAGPTSQVAQKQMVLGYVGTIASWFDWQAVIELAVALPEAQIEIYGPLEAAIPSDLPSSIALRGPVPYEQVFDLMRNWNAGLIPFVRNTLTDSVDPVKYYEYRACGLPVISTMFGEMPLHLQNDPGLWDMQAADLVDSLPQKLQDWEQQRAHNAASGKPGIPDYIKAASWPARFAQGAQAMEGSNSI